MDTTTWKITVGGTEFVVAGVPCEGERKLIAYADLARVYLLVASELVARGAVSGEGFRLLRKTQGLRANELAALLDVSAETLSRWETGERDVPRTAWSTLAAMVADARHGRTDTRDGLVAAGKAHTLPKTVKLGRVA